MTTPKHELDTWCWCGNCGAAKWGVPPHGEDKPCPTLMKRIGADERRAQEAHEAYIAKLDAERMYYLRGGVAVSDMKDLIGRLTGDE